MAETTLVSFDIENGQRVLDALAKADKAPNVALWAKLPDYEDWRLVIASEHIDQNSVFAGYSQVNEAIERAGIPIHRQPTILLKPMDDPMILALRQTFAPAADALWNAPRRPKIR